MFRSYNNHGINEPAFYAQPSFHSNYGRGTFHQSEEFWCETCDRGFPTSEKLSQHKQEHQKCNIDGCQFIAHPKVITKHIQMQHSTGLYKKIANLKNPDEIAKWREERKRKYPTKLNIEKKAAQLKEKIDRGEKYGLKQNFNKRQLIGDDKPRKHQNFGNDKRGHYQNKQRQYEKRQSTHIKNRKQTLSKVTNVAQPDSNSLHKLKPFLGIQNIILESAEELVEDIQSFDIVDDDLEVTQPSQDKPQQNDEPKVCGALSSLICNYVSSEDENEVDLNESKSAIVAEIETNKSSKENCLTNNNNDEDSGPEEVKNKKNNQTDTCIIENVAQKANKNKPLRKNNPNWSRVVKHHKKPKVPSTLLQKLLHREIEHERNIVLQCIRHVVNNNFFDK